MANICKYKVIVKGKKDACYALYWSMSVMDGISIEDEGGSDDDYMIRFEGNCKWTVDAYCKPWDGSFDVDIPATLEDALKYRGITVQERSRLFKVEVLCNSADMVEEDYELYEHYISGDRISSGGCPEELKVLDGLAGLDDLLEVSIKCDDRCCSEVVLLLERITADFELDTVNITEHSSDNMVVIEDIESVDVSEVLSTLVVELTEKLSEFEILVEVPELYKFIAKRIEDKLSVARIDTTNENSQEVKKEYPLDDDWDYDETLEDICYSILDN